MIDVKWKIKYYLQFSIINNNVYISIETNEIVLRKQRSAYLLNTDTQVYVKSITFCDMRTLYLNNNKQSVYDNYLNDPIVKKNKMKKIASAILSSLKDKPKLKLLVVMILVPGVLNCLQYWFTDNFIKDHDIEANEEKEAALNKGNSFEEGDKLIV